MDSFSLMDHSQAVCTIGGSAGWEAIVRGRPVLFYGSLWYQCCKSVFVINSYNEAIKAIKAIMDGFVPDRKDVDRFAEAMYRSCVHGLIFGQEYSKKIKMCSNPRYEMDRIAEFYIEAYKKYYN